MPRDSVFGSLVEATAFLQSGVALCESPPGVRPPELDQRQPKWRFQPLAVEHVESSFFDDSAMLPADSVRFDCALWLRKVELVWGDQPEFCYETA